MAAHPGASRTNLAVDTSLPMKLITWAMRPMLQSAAMGAEPTLRAATDPGAVPGGYYGPDGLFKLRGHAAPQETAPFAHDEAAARRLWDELERMGGITYPLG